MLDNVDLVEEDKRVQDGEGWVVEYAGENNVLEILQAVCIMDLPLDIVVLYPDYLLELGLVGEVMSVVGFVQWEVGVVWVLLADVCGVSVETLTFQSAYNTQHY